LRDGGQCCRETCRGRSAGDEKTMKAAHGTDW
jgi:hypothetical protein